MNYKNIVKLYKIFLERELNSNEIIDERDFDFHKVYINYNYYNNYI